MEPFQLTAGFVEQLGRLPPHSSAHELNDRIDSVWFLSGGALSLLLPIRLGSWNGGPIGKLFGDSGDSSVVGVCSALERWSGSRYCKSVIGIPRFVGDFRVVLVGVGSNHGDGGSLGNISCLACLLLDRGIGRGARDCSDL